MRSYRKWCACFSRSNRKRPCPEITLLFTIFFPVLFYLYFFPRTIFPYFFVPYFFSPTFFFRHFCFVPFFSYVFLSSSIRMWARLFSPDFLPVYFCPYFFLPILFFPYYFPVIFQKSRRLKSNVLKYQLVVFIVHVVITQFMFLAEYPFKHHP